MTPTLLMETIKGNWGTLLDDTCKSSSIPSSFLAALIANESGGDPHAKRYEPAVLGALWSVLLERAPAYGSIHESDLVQFLSAEAAGSEITELAARPSIITVAMLRLDDLATSQGLTQIMGYEALSFKLGSVDAIADPQTSLSLTIKMLAQFATRYSLDLASDFDQLFDCWNTGRPHGKTFDPNYVANGIERMKLYAGLT